MLPAQGENSTPERYRIRTESVRERDVFRYLYPWQSVYKQAALDRLAFSSDGEAQPTLVPTVCPDTALVAFAQLCALRLRVSRCFVTLISSSVEYILVEATKSMSLQYDKVDNVDDQIWLGTGSFLIGDGLNAAAKDKWRKARQLRHQPKNADFYYTEGVSPHWHIICDALTSDQWGSTKFVKHGPRTRFFASIPLRGPLGSVLGSLTIVDNAPRYGVSASEMAYMEDIADTIAAHLDATLVRSQRQRSERLIQSLGLFNSGKSSLRHWWLRQEDARIRSGRHKAQAWTSEEQQDALVEEFGLQSLGRADNGYSPQELGAIISVNNVASANDMQAADGQSEAASRKGRSASSLSGGSYSDDRHHVEGRTSPASNPSITSHEDPDQSSAMSSATDTFDLSRETRQIYARASNLMREALSADGVVFTSIRNANKLGRSGPFGSSALSSRSGSAHRVVSSDSDESDSRSTGKAGQCEVYAFATADNSSIHDTTGTSPQHYAFSEAFMAALVKRYPRGHIFNFTQSGLCYPGSGEESMASGSNSESINKQSRLSKDGRRLEEVLHGARTIGFFPIWDEPRDTWRACALVWSTSIRRQFDPVEDITYLASWSHSLLAGLSKLESIASDKAKGSFISSVSHEMRSPLHGILVGMEFLQETELNPFQQEMAHSVTIAGRTLLDTVDHILDHSKISSFIRARKAKKQSGSSKRIHSYFKGVESEATPSVDLAVLTEELVETVVSAYRFQHLYLPPSERLNVVLAIPPRKNWQVDIERGIWTRIVLNLVGNALKYTNTGHVSVQLQVDDDIESEEGLHQLRLIVEDTGIGMSKQFLANDIFTPFKQENSHSAGTGLGLSIVQQITSDMGGDLAITSELGIGTRISIAVNALFKANVQGPNADDGLHQRSLELDVHHFHLIHSATPTPSAGTNALTPVAEAILEIAQTWLRCEVSEGPVLDTKPAAKRSVFAIGQEDFVSWMNEGEDTLRKTLNQLSTHTSHLLIFGQDLHTVSFQTPPELPIAVTFIHQPIGPEKLIRAITTGQNSTTLERVEDTDHHSFVPPAGRSQNASIYTSNTRATTRSQQASLRTESDAGKDPAHRDTGRQTATVSRPGVPSSSSQARPSVLNRGSGKAIGPATNAENVSESPSPPLGGDGQSQEVQRNNVLLVEDNEINMKLLIALMQKLKLPYLCAHDGLEAVNMYRMQSSRIFLTLMDISMPVMDGVTATAKIRELEHSQRLPRCFIAALTGVTSAEAKNNAFSSGVDEFFSKPVKVRELRELVQRAQNNIQAMTSSQEQIAKT